MEIIKSRLTRSQHPLVRFALSEDEVCLKPAAAYMYTCHAALAYERYLSEGRGVLAGPVLTDAAGHPDFALGELHPTEVNGIGLGVAYLPVAGEAFAGLDLSLREQLTSLASAYDPQTEVVLMLLQSRSRKQWSGIARGRLTPRDLSEAGDSDGVHIDNPVEFPAMDALTKYALSSRPEDLCDAAAKHVYARYAGFAYGAYLKSGRGFMLAPHVTNFRGHVVAQRQLRAYRGKAPVSIGAVYVSASSVHYGNWPQGTREFLAPHIELYYPEREIVIVVLADDVPAWVFTQDGKESPRQMYDNSKDRLEPELGL